MSASPYDTGVKWDRFFCVPGESCDRTLEFHVRSIYIDNLSDSWLYLPDLARYIPPLTLGWQANYNGPTNRIRVQASAAPPGGIQSSNTGGNVTIDVYSINKGESFGTTLGSVSNQAQASQILVAVALGQLGMGAVQLVAGIAGKRIVLLYWSIGERVSLPGPTLFTGAYTVELASNTGLFAALDANNIYNDYDLYPYGISSATGAGFDIISTSSDGSMPDFLSLGRYYVSEA